MISASHNPFEDNGIKLFGPDGTKLSDETEAEIEALMDSALLPTASPSRPTLGRASRLEDAAGRYIEAAKASFPRGLRLDGPEDRRRLRQRRRLPRRADGVVGAGRHRHPGGRRAGRVQHQPRLRLDRAGVPLRAGGGAWRASRHRAGRRRRPRGDGRRAWRADRRRPDPGADRPILGRGRAAARRRHRRHGDVQSRAGAVPARRRPGRCTAPRSATATWRSACAQSAPMSAASNPAT